MSSKLELLGEPECPRQLVRYYLVDLESEEPIQSALAGSLAAWSIVHAAIGHHEPETACRIQTLLENIVRLIVTIIRSRRSYHC